MSSLLNSMIFVDKAKVYWPRLLALCLYSQFLLVSLYGDCDPKILSILDQVKAGQNPFPLILAETIHGLDKFAETRYFSGSLMLLEVSLSFIWLFIFVLLSFCPFIILRRPGFMKNWGCWSHPETLVIIGPNITELEGFILFRVMYVNGYLLFLTLWFNGCVHGRDCSM